MTNQIQINRIHQHVIQPRFYTSLVSLDQITYQQRGPSNWPAPVFVFNNQAQQKVSFKLRQVRRMLRLARYDQKHNRLPTEASRFLQMISAAAPQWPHNRNNHK